MEPEFVPLSLQSWSRGEVFYYFSKMEPTGWSVTVRLDVTRLRRTLKAAGYRFYPAYLWLVTRTLMEQPEAFCLAERDGQVGYFRTLTPLYAVFHDDDKTFSLLWTAYDAAFPAFHAAFLVDRAQYGAQHGVLAKKRPLPPENAYTVSCLPWIGFDHFAVHSYGSRPYYFPSVEAGKFCEEDGRTLLPLSVTCHHAASDGWHVSLFLTQLQQGADAFDAFL